MADSYITLNSRLNFSAASSTIFNFVYNILDNYELFFKKQHANFVTFQKISQTKLLVGLV